MSAVYILYVHVIRDSNGCQRRL